MIISLQVGAVKTDSRQPARRRTQRGQPLPRIIRDESDIREGMRVLRRRCAIMRRIHDIAGDPPLRRNPAGLAGRR